jgi:ATP-dependent DNA helicase RecG
LPEFKEVSGGFSVVFRKDIYTEEYLRNLGFNERQIKAVMYVKEKGKITNKNCNKRDSNPSSVQEKALSLLFTCG